MKASAALAAAAALAFVQSPLPAMAQDAASAVCTAPTAPAAPDGAAATLEQMKAAGAAAKQFIADSDLFQQCEVEKLAAQREAAKAAKQKFDASLAKATSARIGENQKQKEAVGGAYSAAVKAYKAAHPS